MKKIKKKININKKSKDFKSRFPLVSVHWHDIVSDSSWMPMEQLEQGKLAVCVTKGHLISQTKGVTRLFGDYSTNDDGTLAEVGNTTIIPNSVIIKIEKI